MTNNYISISSVQTYLPEYVKEEMDEPTINKWILQGFRQNVTVPNWIYQTKFCLLQLDNHVATLPQGLKKITIAQYLQNIPSTSVDQVSDFILPVIGNERVFLAQAIVYQYFRPYAETMRFVGQNTDLLVNGCINIFCDCSINFSLDVDLNTIKTDLKDGYVVLLYESEMQNDDGEFLMPNDEDLKEALGYFVEAKLWRERSGRKEEGGENMFFSRMQLANNKFKEFTNKNLLRYFQPSDYIFKSRTVNQIHQIAVERDRRNF